MTSVRQTPVNALEPFWDDILRGPWIEKKNGRFFFNENDISPNVLIKDSLDNVHYGVVILRSMKKLDNKNEYEFRDDKWYLERISTEFVVAVNIEDCNDKHDFRRYRVANEAAPQPSPLLCCMMVFRAHFHERGEKNGLKTGKLRNQNVPALFLYVYEKMLRAFRAYDILEALALHPEDKRSIYCLVNSHFQLVSPTWKEKFQMRPTIYCTNAGTYKNKLKNQMCHSDQSTFRALRDSLDAIQHSSDYKEVVNTVMSYLRNINFVELCEFYTYFNQNMIISVEELTVVCGQVASLVAMLTPQTSRLRNLPLAPSYYQNIDLSVCFGCLEHVPPPSNFSFSLLMCLAPRAVLKHHDDAGVFCRLNQHCGVCKSRENACWKFSNSSVCVRCVYNGLVDIHENFTCYVREKSEVAVSVDGKNYTIDMGLYSNAACRHIAGLSIPHPQMLHYYNFNDGDVVVSINQEIVPKKAQLCVWSSRQSAASLRVLFSSNVFVLSISEKEALITLAANPDSYEDYMIAKELERQKKIQFVEQKNIDSGVRNEYGTAYEDEGTLPEKDDCVVVTSTDIQNFSVVLRIILHKMLSSLCGHGLWMHLIKRYKWLFMPSEQVTNAMLKHRGWENKEIYIYGPLYTETRMVFLYKKTACKRKRPARSPPLPSPFTSTMYSPPPMAAAASATQPKKKAKISCAASSSAAPSCDTCMIAQKEDGMPKGIQAALSWVQSQMEMGKTYESKVKWKRLFNHLKMHQMVLI